MSLSSILRLCRMGCEALCSYQDISRMHARLSALGISILDLPARASFWKMSSITSAMSTF